MSTCMSMFISISVYKSRTGGGEVETTERMKEEISFTGGEEVLNFLSLSLSFV